MSGTTAATPMMPGAYTPSVTASADTRSERGGSERAMEFWSHIFQLAAWVGVAGFVVWSIVGLTVFAGVRDPYALASQRELARLQLSSALVWAAVSVVTALSNFFFSAVLRGAVDVVRLLRMQPRGG